jgi:hypothetical protein
MNDLRFDQSLRIHHSILLFFNSSISLFGPNHLTSFLVPRYLSLGSTTLRIILQSEPLHASAPAATSGRQHSISASLLCTSFSNIRTCFSRIYSWFLILLFLCRKMRSSTLVSLLGLLLISQTLAAPKSQGSISITITSAASVPTAHSVGSPTSITAQNLELRTATSSPDPSSTITTFALPSGISSVEELTEQRKWHVETYWSCVTFPLTTHCGWHEPVLPGGTEIAAAPRVTGVAGGVMVAAAAAVGWGFL